MALISCPECNKSISDRSVACPHCGLPSMYFKQVAANYEARDKAAVNILTTAPFKEYILKYPELSQNIIDLHQHLLACGFKCEVDTDKVKYTSGRKIQYHFYPSKKKLNNVTLLLVGNGPPFACMFSPTTSTKKTKDYISKVATDFGLIGVLKVTNVENTDPLDYKELKNMLISFDKDYNQLFTMDKYISTREISSFRNIYDKYKLALNNQLIMQYIKTNASSLRIDDIQLDRFFNKMQSIDIDVEVHNSSFVNRKLREYEAYFDNLLIDIDKNIRLDEEQRRAVLTDDNHCLLVAGAGAGKTTTMAAKVKYLVEKQGVNPEDIIVISYTNKAIDELKDRINKKLRIPAKINTFHSFAYEIVKKSTSEPPEVNFHAYQIVFDILEKAIFNNKNLMRNLVLFLGYYFDLPEEAFTFNSLNEYHAYKAASDYETLKSGLGEYIKEVAQKRSKRVKTITGEYLRSMQEVQIANLLYLYNIDYEYEKPYPFEIPGSKKKYTPDFFIRQGENECYIEHFGITESLRSNIYTPQQLERYKKRIKDKREIHRSFKTDLIETWSFYNDKRPLTEHLKEELKKKGFILKSRNFEEIYKKIVETGKDKYIFKLIYFMLDFIEQFKTSGYDEGGFDILRQKTDNVRTLLFLDIAQQVYNHYQETLSNRNQLDFADMINDANFYLLEMEKSGIDLSYKYIIIDEFQDIARQRFNFTKRLSQITGAKVVAVGDDWQSIYAFAGSDISLFTKFIELMGSGTELKITHTYRNSQELIDIAGSFIQKNSTQIRKKLISPKQLKNPIILEQYDDSSSIQKNLAAAVVRVIGKILTEFGEKSSILLIGRYNYDMYKLFRTEVFEELPNNKVKCTEYPYANLTFMTAHSSKGLGYDNVILLNMTESKFGFPCQIEDDPIIKLVTYEDNSMPFAEERRLFYVALTRTKNRVYIAAPLNRPSRFLVELITDYNIPHPPGMNLSVVDLFSLRCPVCKFPLKYEFNKNYGLSLYICTNEPQVCDFMTNNRVVKKDIFKCNKCKDGYMIVKTNQKNSESFYGCSNFGQGKIGCKNAVSI